MRLDLSRRLAHLLAADASSPSRMRRQDGGPTCLTVGDVAVTPLDAAPDGSSRCFAPPDGAGARLTLQPCTAQNWAAVQLIGGHLQLGSQLCLDAVAPRSSGPGVAEAVACAMGDVRGRHRARRGPWLLEDGRLRRLGTGACLDYTAALQGPSMDVAMAPCNASGAHQAFVLGAPAGVRVPPWPETTATASDAALTPDAAGRPGTETSASSAPGSAPTPSTSVDADVAPRWRDDFSGTALDLSQWNFVVDCNNANHELQCYTDRPENARVEGGQLLLQARREAWGGRDFTSARINTYGKLDFAYGRVEARIKLPCGRGLWPAFWLMPTDSVYGGWPRSGELDVMEFLGHDARTIYGTAHFGERGSMGGKTQLAQGSFCDDHHIFGAEWRADAITWTLDGSPYARMTNTQGRWAPAPKWPYDERFYLIFNVAVGGDWPGAPDPSLQGGTMAVDWVRVLP